MTLTMLGTPAEIEARIKRVSMVLEIIPGDVVRDENGRAVGMEVEVWL